jgi:hypothetical protein
LDRERASIAAAGIIMDASTAEIVQTKEAYGLSFPIFQDVDGSLIEALGVPSTPWKTESDAKVVTHMQGSWNSINLVCTCPNSADTCGCAIISEQ